jgi:hypothetical protein
MVLSHVDKGVLDDDGARDVQLGGGGIKEGGGDADGQVGMDALGDGAARLGLGGDFADGVGFDDVFRADEVVGMPLLGILGLGLLW